MYITLPWLPRYHNLGHAYTVSLRFSRWKPGHWWWQLELPEMLILERLALEMSILEKLRSAEQVRRCRSQCSLESRWNRPWQIGKSPAGLFWTWHAHGKEKQGRVVGADQCGKWMEMEPGFTWWNLKSDPSKPRNPSAIEFGDVLGWLIVDSTTCSPKFGIFVPSCQAAPSQPFQSGGLTLTRVMGLPNITFSQIEWQRNQWDAPCLLGVSWSNAFYVLWEMQPAGMDPGGTAMMLRESAGRHQE